MKFFCAILGLLCIYSTSFAGSEEELRAKIIVSYNQAACDVSDAQALIEKRAFGSSNEIALASEKTEEAIDVLVLMGPANVDKIFPGTNQKLIDNEQSILLKIADAHYHLKQKLQIFEVVQHQVLNNDLIPARGILENALQKLGIERLSCTHK